jgi:DNA-directed RNA polymerase sigma subunit (sigma70/sigma32)
MSGLHRSQYHCTLDEVSEEIGVCRERVRQIEKEALRKLRIAMEARGITATELDGDTSPQPLFDILKVL